MEISLNSIISLTVSHSFIQLFINNVFKKTCTVFVTDEVLYFVIPFVFFLILMKDNLLF